MLTKLIRLVCIFVGSFQLALKFFFSIAVQEAARARRDSYISSNPLSIGGGGLGPRGGKTPLGWLTGKLTGVGAR